MMKKTILLFGVICLLFKISSAQEPEWYWAKSEGGSDYDCGKHVTTDINGNVLVTGFYFSSAITFGNFTFTNKGADDIFIVKYDPYGNVLWARSDGNSGYDVAESIETDQSGNVYITGTFNGAPSTIIGDDTLTNTGLSDIFIAKYDENGNELWAKSVIGGSYDRSCDIAIDISGNAYITGYFQSYNFNIGGVALSHSNNDNYFIAKFDTNGNVIWAQSAGGNSLAKGFSIATDQSSNVLVTGYFMCYSIIFGNDTLNNFDLTHEDIFVVKYDSSGNVLWAGSNGGDNRDFVSGVALDQAGNVYLTGLFASSSIIVGNDTITDNGGNNWDIYIIKYDAAGNPLWAKSAGGTEEDDGVGISTDLMGNAYITGYFYSSSISFGDYTLANNGQDDIFIAKYDSDGNVIWAKNIGGEWSDIVCSIAVHNSRSIYITGYYCSSSINFGDIEINNDSLDIFIANLSYHNISGVVFNDFNNNGIKDSLEQGVAEHLIKLEPGPVYTTSDNDGYYGFSVIPGVYNITYIPSYNWHLTTDSATYTAHNTSSNNYAGLDFGVNVKEGIRDVGIYLTGTATRINKPTQFWINYKNWGSLTTNGQIQVTYDSLLSFTNSIPNEDSHIANILEYTYDTLANNEERLVAQYYEVPGIQFLGDTIISVCKIEPLIGDTNINNNFDTLIQVIIGPCDPNDKQVSPSGAGAEGYVQQGQKLTYTIRFQNTGTDTAYNVVVKDTLDPNMDIETFMLLAASHDVSYKIKGQGIINFYFDNIMLPDSNVNEPESHGFVKYSVLPKQGISDNTVVTNSASIFFDLNPPIVTNTVKNTYITDIITGTSDNDKFNSIKIFPNPALNCIMIEVNSKATIEIFNINGQIIEKIISRSDETEVDLTDLSSGVYIVRVKTDKEIVTKKFIKE
jgi:uncharacterized repeat protein (TIGR01451 family)